MRIRVLLVDHQQLLREGLAALLGAATDVEVIGEAGDGADGLQRARELRPHLAVMALAMPGLNGIEATRRMRNERPEVKVLCLAEHDDPRAIEAALEAGARGCVLKRDPFLELSRAVRSVVADAVYLSPSITAGALDAMRSRRANSPSAFLLLTPREREIVQLLAEGHTTKQAAARLHVSQKTIATHREHVMAKLRIRGIAELTRYAIREGLSPL